MRFIGDIHGNFNGLIANLKRKRIRNENLIQVGDFGLGFRSEKDDLLLLNKLNDYLASRGNHLFIIRGNQDDPTFFDGSTQLSNLQLLQDYSVLNLEGKCILLIGGAISIDRRIRKLDINYWKDEGFVFNESKLKSILLSTKNIDVVVTHTAPAFTFPQEFDSIVASYAKKDPALIEELVAERKLLNELYSTIVAVAKPTHWYYGHFHSSKREKINGINFCLLDIDEVKTLR